MDIGAMFKMPMHSHFLDTSYYNPVDMVTAPGVLLCEPIDFLFDSTSHSRLTTINQHLFGLIKETLEHL